MPTALQTSYWESLKGRTSPNKGKKFPYKARPNAIGRKAWNEGISPSKDVCKKMSEKRIEGIAKGSVKSWNKGKKMSKEAIEKNRQAQLGKTLTLETRKRMSESKKGEKSYQWQGGITPENRKIRNSFEMRLWKKACFERDNFTCQRCAESKSGSLNAHHVNNFSSFPELRTSIQNGITLCKLCHQSFHKEYGHKNNTKLQLEEFLNKNI